MDANEQLERAYWLGWRNCAAWADRKDLWDDRGSQAYTQERDDDLGTLLAQQVPADGEGLLLCAQHGITAVKGCAACDADIEWLTHNGPPDDATPQAPQPVVDASQPQQGAVEAATRMGYASVMDALDDLADYRKDTIGQQAGDDAAIDAILTAYYADCPGYQWGDANREAMRKALAAHGKGG